jgi:hypothetical protein
MYVVAYCSAPYEESTRQAAGVQPACCPPLSADNGGLSRLLQEMAVAEFVYLDLHGFEGDRTTLYGGGDCQWTPALRVDQVRGLRLDRSVVVFATSCYFPDSEFLEAFLNAGARAVIAGRGQNFAARRAVKGAALLGLWLRRGLSWGLSPGAALALAKTRSRLQFGPGAATSIRDALEFELWPRSASA